MYPKYSIYDLLFYLLYKNISFYLISSRIRAVVKWGKAQIIDIFLNNVAVF